jgi:N-acyl-D-amino-acid deacylase
VIVQPKLSPEACSNRVRSVFAHDSHGGNPSIQSILLFMKQFLVGFGLALSVSVASAQQPSTLIRNARVVDGSGKPGTISDVRIVGDRISAVGKLTQSSSDHVIDARGLTLAPGFIDTHSHHGGTLFEKPDAIAMVSQGVTTIVAGQDGGGSNLAALFARVDSQSVAVNVASYAGHGSVRRAVMGTDYKRHASADELDRMKALLRTEMQAGALGLSTGLEYDPGIYSAPEEVVALAKVAAEAGGSYISHVRSEDRNFWSALAELINIGRVNRMPVQVSHIKLAMKELWGKADSLISVLNAARRAGVNVTADIYPYTYWQSNFGVFYPQRNFADSVETEFILQHITPADGIIFNNFQQHPEFIGKTLAQIAESRGTSHVRTMLDLLAMPGGTSAGIVARGMADADVERLMQWEFANVCSDGQSSGLHPRGFGSFAKVLGRYVRERKLFTLEEAVRKMSSLAAANVGIQQRGSIKPGYFADLVLFDPATILDHATFEKPQAQAVGVKTVWVNGVIVFDNGAPTTKHPGRAIRR